jgi:hypothetical protein
MYIDFLAASVAMIITLIMGFVPHIYASHHLNPADTIIVFCKIRGYTNQSFGMMYRWFMTMACVDRCIVSSNNVYLRQFSNPRMAYSIVIKIFIIWIILPLHNLVFLNIKSNLCRNSTTAFAIYHSLFTFTFGGILPLLVMIISIILIRCNLASKRARRQRNIYYHQNEDATVRLLSSRDQQVFIMLFIQIGFYVVSTIPWMIFLLYASNTRYIINKSIDRIGIEIFVKYLAEIIAYMYPTLSFYIYTLTSHSFRSELINIIGNLFNVRYRSQYDHRSFVIHAGVGWESEGVQSNKMNNFRLIEMEMYFDCSEKNVSLVEQEDLK